MNKPWLSSLFAGLLLLSAAACHQAGGGEQPPLAGAKLGGPFTLTDQDGKRVSDRDFAGRYRLIYFGYTFCPDVCPTSLQHLAQGLNKLEAQDKARADKIQPIFITVDPQRDTPAVLKQYVGSFHPRLVGLTGTPEEIAAVAKEFAVYYKAQPQEGASGYLVDHMSQAILYGPNGEPLALIPQDGTPDAIAAELAKWVN